jgi:5-methylcytosine-specific restriction endonuclease McrA
MDEFLTNDITDFKHRKQKRNKLIHKKSYKKAQGVCKLCGESNYALLDVHRIVPGRDGGTYHPKNVVTLCSNCHRKVDTNEFEIIGWVASSGGDLLHIIRNGKDEYL